MTLKQLVNFHSQSKVSAICWVPWVEQPPVELFHFLTLLLVIFHHLFILLLILPFHYYSLQLKQKIASATSAIKSVFGKEESQPRLDAVSKNFVCDRSLSQV